MLHTKTGLLAHHFYETILNISLQQLLHASFSAKHRLEALNLPNVQEPQ